MRSSASGRNSGNVASNEKSRIECAERFRAVFEEEYAHLFEFIGGRTSSKGKALIRCRVCGNVFETTGSFVETHSNLTCPRCRVKRDDDIRVPPDGTLDARLVEMRSSRMTVKEIAAATGIRPRYVAQILNENGAYEPLPARKTGKRESTVFKEALLDSFKEIKAGIPRPASARALAKETGKVEGYFACFRRTEEFAEGYAPTFAECSGCGRRYVFFPSNARYGRKKAGSYCSPRCARKANRNCHNISSRLRRHGLADAPRDTITLDALIERDGCTCYLCGRKTDREDHYLSRGWFTIGDSYPTIDHVVPLAKGGTHTWGNVRLACRLCNSRKRDELLEVPIWE